MPFGFVFGHALTVWFLARVVMGLGSGGLWMGITFATLERWPGQEYLCMSRVFAAYSVGGLVGPALGAIGGIRGPFAAYLALVGASGTCALMLRSTSTRRHFRAGRAALRLRGFWVASAAISFVVLALGACVLIVSGLGFAGSSASIPIWIGALILVGIGIGIGNTGAIGLLFAAVGAERIVTAMIIWSQIGILGCLAGPLVGGLAAQALGYGAVAIVPLVHALPLVAFLVLRSSELDGTGGAAR